VSNSKTFLIVAALLLAGSTFAGTLEVQNAESVGMSSTQLQAYKDHLQGLVDDGTSAGFQVVVARHGKIVLQEAIGSKDVTTGEPITDDTLFRIFSMTKPIVATAMMILYEEGRYSLNDPIAKYIPQFADLQVYVGVDEVGEMILEDPVRPPTMHDLFLHTAGFTYGIFGDSPVDRMYRDKKIVDQTATIEQFINRLSTIPLAYQPGTEYIYSVAADVEGYLVQVLSGMGTEAFIQSRILSPLGMDETVSWVQPDRAQLLSKIHAHNDEGELVLYSGPPESDFTNYALQEPIAFSGGGQLISTADDYWRFAQMLLNGGVFEGERILSRSSVHMMTSNRLPETLEGRRIEPGWGHGFNLSVVIDPTLVGYPVSMGEYGHGGLATTHFVVDPELDLVSVIISQYLPPQNDFYRDVVHRMVLPAVID
jgi:CubicO group peptidase (beta-lactamase class C family)